MKLTQIRIKAGTRQSRYQSLFQDTKAKFVLLTGPAELLQTVGLTKDVFQWTGIPTLGIAAEKTYYKNVLVEADLVAHLFHLDDEESVSVSLFSSSEEFMKSEAHKSFAGSLFVTGPETLLSPLRAREQTLSGAYFDGPIYWNDRELNNHICTLEFNGLGDFSQTVHHGLLPFGPVRTIEDIEATKLNVIDGTAAKDVFSTYIGDTVGLSAQGLLNLPMGLVSEADEKKILNIFSGVEVLGNAMVLDRSVLNEKTFRFLQGTPRRLLSGAVTPRVSDKLHFQINCAFRYEVLRELIFEEFPFSTNGVFISIFVKHQLVIEKSGLKGLQKFVQIDQKWQVS